MQMFIISYVIHVALQYFDQVVERRQRSVCVYEIGGYFLFVLRLLVEALTVMTSRDYCTTLYSIYKGNVSLSIGGERCAFSSK